MKIVKIAALVALFGASLLCSVQAEVSTIDIATFAAKNNLSDEFEGKLGSGKTLCDASGRPSYECPSYLSFASGVCLASGRPTYECPSYVKLAQAICLAGGRPGYECPSYASVAQGICLSTGRPSYECPSYVDVAPALCLAKGQPTYMCSSVSLNTALSMNIIDVAWAWDRFYDELRTSQWRCRGRSTGQFAEDSSCSGKTKVDDTWPGMQRPF